MFFWPPSCPFNSDMNQIALLIKSLIELIQAGPGMQIEARE